MKFHIAGGAWISSRSHGSLNGKNGAQRPSFDGGSPVDVPASMFSDCPIKRHGRFDHFTRLVFSAAGLALRDAGFATGGEKKNAGVVMSSKHGCLAADLDYCAGAMESGGELASPNLFSYTLPGIALGECAIHFLLAGPALCVGGDGGAGMAAVGTACMLLEAGAAEFMLAGWADCVQGFDDPQNGAAFVLLSKSQPKSAASIETVGGDILLNGNIMTSIQDVF